MYNKDYMKIELNFIILFYKTETPGIRFKIFIDLFV